MNPVNNPLMSWTEAMDQPGAVQMRIGRQLIESRPILTRVPDDAFTIRPAMPERRRHPRERVRMAEQRVAPRYRAEDSAHGPYAAYWPSTASSGKTRSNSERKRRSLARVTNTVLMRQFATRSRQ